MKFVWAVAALGGLAACTETNSGTIPSTSVTVRVIGNLQGQPLSDVPVAFVDLNGQGRVVTTDSDGYATGAVQVGGSITAVMVNLPPDNPPMLATRLDVKDADMIELGFVANDLAPPPTGTAACDQTTVAATYHHAVVNGVSEIYAQRWATQAEPPAEVGPLAISEPTTTTLSGAGAVKATLATDLHGESPGFQQQIVEAIDGCATAYDVDLADMLPWVGDPSYSGGVVQIPLTGGTIAADFQVTDMTFGSDPSDYINWQFFGPQSREIKLPRLPDELDQYNVAPDAVAHSAAVALVDYADVDGYDDARQHISVGNSIGGAQGPSVHGRQRTSYRIILL